MAFFSGLEGVGTMPRDRFFARVCSAALLIIALTSRLAAQDIATLKEKAASGDVYAEYNLGVVYHEGTGVPKDYVQSAAWFRKAADQGNATAQWSLGAAYNFGQGVTKDYAQAAFWYSKAAAQGNAEAQCYLGQLYLNGQGVTQDFGQAAVWYRKAAEQGNAVAQLNLGSMYRTGQGVPKDDTQAAFWTREAADQGLADAQNDLGVMYHEGRGVPRDDGAAAAWYRKAAEQGDAAAHQNLDALPLATPKSASTEDTFPLQVTIETTFDAADLISISQQQILKAAAMGIEPPFMAVFHGKINGEDHWVFGCRYENPLRQSLPCTNLPLGQYKGRWIHDYSLIQIVGGTPESPLMRFLTVSNNVKSPPSADDPILHGAVFDFPVRFPDGKNLKDYPLLVHVYGGASLELPVGQLPARGNCSVYSWSAYQTSVNCASYPAIEIHRGYVTLDISVEAASFASLHCEAKWRWSHCAMLDPGLYYARMDKSRMVLLTHNEQEKPQEVGFDVELPRDGTQSPIK